MFALKIINETNNIKPSSMNKISAYNILSMIIIQGIGFFSSPIFSRLLGTENYGIVSVYNTWVSIIVIVVGLQTYSTIAVAENEFGIEEQKRYQSSVFCLSIIAFLVFDIVVIAFLDTLSSFLNFEKRVVIIMLIHSIGQFAITYLNFKFTYEFEAKKNFWISLAIVVCNITLSFVFIYFFSMEYRYYGRILGFAITYIGIGAVASIYIIKSGKLFYSGKYWGFCLTLSLPVVIHNVSGLILSQSDRVMLQNIRSNSEVGIYCLAYTFAGIISTLWNALNNSWVPFFYKYTREGEYNDIKRHTKNYLELFTVLSLGFVLLSPEVFRVFAGRMFWDGIYLIPIFVIGFYFMFLYSFPVNYEFFCKQTKIIAIGTTISAFINIILNYYMIKYVGMIGAAISTLLSYILLFMFHCYFANRISKINDTRYMYKCVDFMPYGLVVSLISIAVCIYGERTSVIRWGCAMVVGVWEMYRLKCRKSIF